MTLTIDLDRFFFAIMQTLLFFGLEFIAFGYIKVIHNPKCKTWERVLAYIEIVLVFLVVFLRLY